MLKGFKDFIMRGNVIDLAVAIVIGAAFAALVSAFTAALIKPAIGLVFGGGPAAGTFQISGQVFDYGLLINALITFVITAAVVYFVFVLPMNEFRERYGGAELPAKISEEVELLREIRDSLKSRP